MKAAERDVAVYVRELLEGHLGRGAVYSEEKRSGDRTPRLLRKDENREKRDK